MVNLNSMLSTKIRKDSISIPKEVLSKNTLLKASSSFYNSFLPEKLIMKALYLELLLSIDSLCSKTTISLIDFFFDSLLKNIGDTLLQINKTEHTMSTKAVEYIKNTPKENFYTHINHLYYNKDKTEKHIIEIKEMYDIVKIIHEYLSKSSHIDKKTKLTTKN
jgi:hypothetical protein